MGKKKDKDTGGGAANKKKAVKNEAKQRAEWKERGSSQMRSVPLAERGKGKRLRQLIAGAEKGTHDEFTIGFTIHEVRDMLTTDGNAIDPLVVVRCLGYTYVSQKKENKRDHASFEETYTWSGMKLMQSQFEAASVVFELQAARTFWANEVVGSAIVSCPLVRTRRNHAFNRRWVDIRDGIRHRGRIMVSVTAYASGDDPGGEDGGGGEEDSDDAGAAALDDLNKIVINQVPVTDASIKAQMKLRKAYYVAIQVHRLEGLGGPDGPKYNPYIEVSFAGRKLRSAVSFQTRSCNFNEAFQLPVITPLFDDSIVIQVKDYLIGRKDKVLIQGRLSFSSLRNTVLSPRYFNFYSFPKSEIQNPVAFVEQSGIRSEPNEFFGRLLISGRSQLLDSLSDCNDARIIAGGIRVEEPPQTARRIIFDVFKCSGMPGTQVFVKLGFADKSLKSTAADRVLPSAKRASAAAAADDSDGEIGQRDMLEKQGTDLLELEAKKAREQLDKKKDKELAAAEAKAKARDKKKKKKKKHSEATDTHDEVHKKKESWTDYAHRLEELEDIMPLPGEFHFAQSAPMSMGVMVPDDPEQQCDLVIAVYALFRMPKPESAGRSLSDRERSKFRRIGYHRMKFEQLQDFDKGGDRPPFWLHLLPLPHLPPIIAPGAVLVQLGQRAGRKRRDEDSAGGQRGIELVKFELRMGLCSCRDLTSPRPDGSRPSPVVEIQCGGETVLSSQKLSTHQPVYVERIQLDVELPKVRSSNKMSPEPIVLSVYDQSEVSTPLAELVRAIYQPSSFLVEGAKTVAHKLYHALADTFLGTDAIREKEKAVFGQQKLLIGRCRFRVHTFTKPGSIAKIRPQWLELYGGTNNQTWVGDILFSAELVRKSDAKLVKPTLLNPPRKPCVLQFAIRSLNDIPHVAEETQEDQITAQKNLGDPVPLLDGGDRPKQAVLKPTMVINVPQYSEVSSSGLGNTLKVDWDRQLAPRHSRNEEDLSNPSWSTLDPNPSTSFGFLEVHSLYVEFPIDPIWCPIAEVHLYDRYMQNQWLGTGAINLVECLPWVDFPDLVTQYVEASNLYQVQYEEGDEADALVVSDSDEEKRKKRRQEAKSRHKLEEAKAKYLTDAEREGDLFMENESDFEDDDFVGDALKMFVKWHYKSHNDFADFINMQGNFLMVEAEQELSAAIEEMKDRTAPQVESAPRPPKAGAAGILGSLADAVAGIGTAEAKKAKDSTAAPAAEKGEKKKKKKDKKKKEGKHTMADPDFCGDDDAVGDPESSDSSDHGSSERENESVDEDLDDPRLADIESEDDDVPSEPCPSEEEPAVEVDNNEGVVLVDGGSAPLSLAKAFRPMEELVQLHLDSKVTTTSSSGAIGAEGAAVGDGDATDLPQAATKLQGKNEGDPSDGEAADEKQDDDEVLEKENAHRRRVLDYLVNGVPLNNRKSAGSSISSCSVAPSSLIDENVSEQRKRIPTEGFSSRKSSSLADDDDTDALDSDATSYTSGEVEQMELLERRRLAPGPPPLPRQEGLAAEKRNRSSTGQEAPEERARKAERFGDFVLNQVEQIIHGEAGAPAVSTKRASVEDEEERGESESRKRPHLFYPQEEASQDDEAEDTQRSFGGIGRLANSGDFGGTIAIRPSEGPHPPHACQLVEGVVSAENLAFQEEHKVQRRAAPMPKLTEKGAGAADAEANKVQATPKKKIDLNGMRVLPLREDEEEKGAGAAEQAGAPTASEDQLRDPAEGEGRAEKPAAVRGEDPELDEHTRLEIELRNKDYSPTKLLKRLNEEFASKAGGTLLEDFGRDELPSEFIFGRGPSVERGGGTLPTIVEGQHERVDTTGKTGTSAGLQVQETGSSAGSEKGAIGNGPTSSDELPWWEREQLEKDLADERALAEMRVLPDLRRNAQHKENNKRRKDKGGKKGATASSTDAISAAKVLNEKLRSFSELDEAEHMSGASADRASSLPVPVAPAFPKVGASAATGSSETSKSSYRFPHVDFLRSGIPKRKLACQRAVGFLKSLSILRQKGVDLARLGSTSVSEREDDTTDHDDQKHGWLFPRVFLGRGIDTTRTRSPASKTDSAIRKRPRFEPTPRPKQAVGDDLDRLAEEIEAPPTAPASSSGASGSPTVSSSAAANPNPESAAPLLEGSHQATPEDLEYLMAQYQQALAEFGALENMVMNEQGGQPTPEQEQYAAQLMEIGGVLEQQIMQVQAELEQAAAAAAAAPQGGKKKKKKGGDAGDGGAGDGGAAGAAQILGGGVPMPDINIDAITTFDEIEQASAMVAEHMRALEAQGMQFHQIAEQNGGLSPDEQAAMNQLEQAFFACAGMMEALQAKAQEIAAAGPGAGGEMGARDSKNETSTAPCIGFFCEALSMDLNRKIAECEAQVLQLEEFEKDATKKLAKIDKDLAKMPEKLTKVQKKRVKTMQEQRERLAAGAAECAEQKRMLRDRVLMLKAALSEDPVQQFRLQLLDVYRQQLQEVSAMKSAMEAELKAMPVVLPEHKAEFEAVSNEVERLQNDISRIERGESIDDAYEEDGVTLKGKKDEKGAGEEEDYDKFSAEQEMSLGLELYPDSMCPPRLQQFMSPKLAARWEHCKLRAGDLILGMGTTPQQMQNCVAMNAAGCKALLNQMALSCAALRPLYVERRRVRRDEFIVMFDHDDETKPMSTPEYKQMLKTAGALFKKHMKKLGLFLRTDASVRPVRVLKDMHQASFWTNAGVQPGAKLVLVNGVNTEDLNYKQFMTQLGAYLAKVRPLCLVFRATGLDARTVVQDHLEREEILLKKQKIKLDGSSDTKLRLLKKMDKLKLDTPSLPMTMRRMNFRPLRGRRLDVQGMVSAQSAGGTGGRGKGKQKQKGEQEAVLRTYVGARWSRHSAHIGGEWEQHGLEPSRWRRVNLYRGDTHRGFLQVTSRILYQNMRPHRQSRSVLADMFKSQKLRDMHANVPDQIRVRIYVVRATAVKEGVTPTLFFRFGRDVKKYEGIIDEGMSTTNPIFYRVEERDVVFPEESRLEIGLYDQFSEGAHDPEGRKLSGSADARKRRKIVGKDKLDPDCVLGSTIIDLEDRWFNPAFQEGMRKNAVPIEYRPLFSLDENNPKRRGNLEMWVEMLDAEQAATTPAQVLMPPPATELEVRVVVWSLRNITMLVLEEELEEETGSADLLVKASLDSPNFRGQQPQVQETDIHYHSSGMAEYNWRFVYSNINVREGFPLKERMSP
eukprot:g5331.t1